MPRGRQAIYEYRGTTELTELDPSVSGIASSVHATTHAQCNPECAAGHTCRQARAGQGVRPEGLPAAGARGRIYLHSALAGCRRPRMRPMRGMLTHAQLAQNPLPFIQFLSDGGDSKFSGYNIVHACALERVCSTPK